jgi:small subunit ribosomal protein S11
MAKTEPKAEQPEGAAPEGGKKPKKKTFKKRGEKRIVHHGVANVRASFNNTTITITDPDGAVIAWSSAGAVGFKGSRKGTPFAATQAAMNAGNAAKTYGMRTLEVRVKGPGAGRESADPAQRLPAAQTTARVGKAAR